MRKPCHNRLNVSFIYIKVLASDDGLTLPPPDLLYVIVSSLLAFMSMRGHNLEVGYPGGKGRTHKMVEAPDKAAIAGILRFRAAVPVRIVSMKGNACH